MTAWSCAGSVYTLPSTSTVVDGEQRRPEHGQRGDDDDEHDDRRRAPTSAGGGSRPGARRCAAARIRGSMPRRRGRPSGRPRPSEPSSSMNSVAAGRIAPVRARRRGTPRRASSSSPPIGDRSRRSPNADRAVRRAPAGVAPATVAAASAADRRRCRGVAGRVDGAVGRSSPRRRDVPDVGRRDGLRLGSAGVAVVGRRRLACAASSRTSVRTLRSSAKPTRRTSLRRT